jgi:flagellar basal-body rod protein FlgB
LLQCALDEPAIPPEECPVSLIPDATADLVARVMAYQNARHTAIAANVANANTPRYSAFDLALAEAKGEAAPLALARTDPRHLAPDAGLVAAGARVERSDAPARLDGNNVELDAELLKLTENRVMYQTALELYDRWQALRAFARDVR